MCQTLPMYNKYRADKNKNLDDKVNFILQKKIKRRLANLHEILRAKYWYISLYLFIPTDFRKKKKKKEKEEEEDET